MFYTDPKHSMDQNTGQPNSRNISVVFSAPYSNLDHLNTDLPTIFHK